MKSSNFFKYIKLFTIIIVVIIVFCIIISIFYNYIFNFSACIGCIVRIYLCDF